MDLPKSNAGYRYRYEQHGTGKRTIRVNENDPKDKRRTYRNGDGKVIQDVWNPNTNKWERR